MFGLCGRHLAIRASHASGTRLHRPGARLRAQNLITSPAYVAIREADEFHEKWTRPNQLWQTEFTYLKVIGCSLQPSTRFIMSQSAPLPVIVIPNATFLSNVV